MVFCSVAYAVGESWYNVQFPTEKGVYQNSKGLISSYVSPEEKHVYITDSTKFTGSWISFALNSNWAISYSPAYDYWITFQCYGVGLDSISEFSFYPTTFEVRYYDIHTDTYKNHNISDISFGHFDSSQRAGFSCFAKLPDNFNATIHEFVVNGNSGTFPKNLRAVVQLYQVPKNDDGTSAAAAQVVEAIQDQTEQLIAVPDEQVQAAEQFVNDSNAQVQEALSPLMAAEQLSGSLVNAFQSKEKYQVYFPGVAGPFMPDGSTVTIIQPQTVDMSFMDRFSIITDAIGVVMLGLCGWKTLDFLYNTLMKILGKEGDES